MIKAPSKTKLLIIKSYVDLALECPEDKHAAINCMYRIWSEIEDLHPIEERIERQRRLFPETKKPAPTDPETLELIAACKQWRKDQALIEDTEEVAHHGETWKETQDRIFREMQEESMPSVGVSRSAMFTVAQASLAKPKKAQE